MLDTRISYEALKDEFRDDQTLLKQLEASRLTLHLHFNAKYSLQTSSGLTHLSATPSSSMLSVTSGSNSNSGSPTKNYTARFQQKRTTIDELSEFWNLPQKYFQSCDPVRWWYGCRAQFPKLYHLAHDILSIPGIYSVYFHCHHHDLLYFRICCCSRAHILRWVGHNLSSLCKPQTWNHSSSYVGQMQTPSKAKIPFSTSLAFSSHFSYFLVLKNFVIH